MSFATIQGQGYLPEVLVTVGGCNISADVDVAMRQPPWYLCIEYGSKLIILKSTDGGINPTFPDKIVVQLIKGVRELNVVVGKNITFAANDIVGSGKVPLYNVVLQGTDDLSCTLEKGNNSCAGELKLRLQLQNANTNILAAPTQTSSSSTPSSSSLSGYQQQQYPQYTAGSGHYPQASPAASYSGYPRFPYPPLFAVPPYHNYGPYQPLYSSPYPPLRPPPTYNSLAYLSPSLHGIVTGASLAELLLNLSQLFGGAFFN